jgi:hypothetical protein
MATFFFAERNFPITKSLLIHSHCKDKRETLDWSTGTVLHSLVQLLVASLSP